MHRALRRAAAHHGLELARQVGEGRVADVAALDLLDLRRRVEDLVVVEPGQRAAEDDPGSVAAGLGGRQAHRFEQLPDFRDALDLDPVQLDVLPVGDVGGAAGEPAGDVTDHVQLLGAELAAVDPDPEHEVAVVELLGLQDGGLAAVDARPALRVQAEPAEPAAQVSGIDRVEPLLGVDVDDPLADVQPVVVLLVLFVLVERLAVAERPLAFAAGATGSALSGARWHAAGVLRLSGARARRPEARVLRSTPSRYWPDSPPAGSAWPVAVGQSGVYARFRDTRPVYVTGKWSAGGQTDGAADAQQVDVPACDKQGIHGAHTNSITRACTACPCGTGYPGRGPGRTLV